MEQAQRAGPLPGGSGRRRSPWFPKGRQLDPQALARVEALLGERSRERALLIEHLHLLQDTFGCLRAAELQALAELMRLSMAEVYEVATFYAHFDVLTDDNATVALVTVRVCDSISCMLAGAESLLAELPAGLGPEVRVVRAPCVGRCAAAPACLVGRRAVEHADLARVRAVVASGDPAPELPSYPDLPAYRAAGGYRLLDWLRADGPEVVAADDRGELDLLASLNSSGLRGMGGAGFPTGRKWDLVRSRPKPRYLCVNADESEPGTFKDRHYLETDPHRFLEGMLLAAWSIGAERAFVYLRDEYAHLHVTLAREIAALEQAKLARPGYLMLRRGAGAYICGEESAMIESLEGQRGYPRLRPPYVAEVGLFGRPTLVNNVETLFWIRDIVEKGPDWYAAQGRNGGKGLRGFSVSGRVKEPGVKIAPAGITARELIDEFSGGMAPGHHFKAYLPGGASGGILPESLADIPLDFGKLEEHGAFVGSHAVIVLSDRDDLKAVVRNLLRFFEDESCGQCTPCRSGTEKAVVELDRAAWDEERLDDLCRLMADASICGLGQAAPNPIRTALRYFRDECLA
jgi:formate dehydrogenase